jgi:adenine deaminase
MEAVQHGWGPLFWATYPDDSYPKHVSDWLKMVIDGAQSRTSDETTEAAASLEQMKKVVRCFSEAGVPMMAGSDMPFVPAGTGLHRELELLVDAGIPNDQAMMMATSIPATYLGLQDEVGTLTVGASADVIAVRGNPLSDITAIGHMEAIWSEGERLDLEELKTKSKSDFDVEPTGFDGTPFGMRDKPRSEQIRAGSA